MNSHPSSANLPESQPAIHDGSPPRRSFFIRFLTGAISLLLGLIPTTLGLGFFLDPLIRKRTSPASVGDSLGSAASAIGDGFLPLAIRVSSLPADGTPVAYKVQADKIDAWNGFRGVDIGTVWLRRISDTEVLALSSICPHLGCAVDFRTAKGDFFCPCHTSSFDLSGSRTNQIPPRAMDQLDTLLKPETGDQIWLRYQNFRAGTATKIPVS
jgi:menaquinol-cytochrome c reductase iron-sulfur subunit